MSTMILVFATSFLLMFFRHLNIRTTATKKVAQTVLYTIGCQSMTLISMALGIQGFLRGDYMTMIAFVAGGALGTLLNFRVKICNCKGEQFLTIKSKHDEDELYPRKGCQCQ